MSNDDFKKIRKVEWLLSDNKNQEVGKVQLLIDNIGANMKRSEYLGEKLAIRLEVFAGRIIRLCENLPSTRSGRHVEDQLFRAVTSAGANYSEAQGAQSQRDFVHKVSLALKEIREGRFWLNVADNADYISEDFTDYQLCQEANELVAILQASQKTARKGLEENQT